MNIVIMAGGGGTRLWPVSREKFPKQFTQLFDSRTLLELTFRRALRLTKDPAHIVVTTRDAYVPEIRRQLPGLPRQNILVESVKRDTAPSIGMAAAFFAARGEHDVPLLMLPSDPYIRDERLFLRALRAARAILQSRGDATVVLGNPPTYPETGYGYIELGRRQSRVRGVAAHAVRRFREKPTLPLAKRFVASRRFVWNIGVYGWRVGTLLDLLHRFAPDIARRVDALERLFAEGASPRQIARVYRRMPSRSIDFAVTERQDPRGLAALAGNYGWSDVGHWGTLTELLGGKTGVELRRGVVAQVHGRGNFVYNAADVAVGLAGVEDLVVVSVPDAVLVCHKGHVQDVKKLVAELARRGHRRFV